MKRVCLKLKRDVLESQINQFLCCSHSFVSTCLFGPTLTLGDILVISAYTQNPRENVDADIHVSSGDRGLNSTAIYIFILYSDERVPLHTLSRVASPSCRTMR